MPHDNQHRFAQMLAKLTSLRNALQEAIDQYRKNTNTTERIDIAGLEYEDALQPMQDASSGSLGGDCLWVLFCNDEQGIAPTAIGSAWWHTFVELKLQKIVRLFMEDDTLICRMGEPLQRIGLGMPRWPVPESCIVTYRLLDNNLKVEIEDAIDQMCPCCRRVSCTATDRTFTVLVARLAITCPPPPLPPPPSSSTTTMMTPTTTSSQ